MEETKNQFIERIKSANNVLITVSTNPSVDQLSAAIGLTLMLNKLKKHATTVFSGDVPSTIEFLRPDDTIETNTDSLRDFIISLDKAKADKIRYKVEDTMVKIFITPYRTSITEPDLVFSQGDFNVDVVVALGVHTREDLDQAITSHGRILHDATVTTVNTAQTSEMGSINWVDDKASSLCEMVVGVADQLKENTLDEQMATALLTGIVAETDRFSNEKTTAVTMSASAKLMAAGANQQLVATKLEVPEEVAETEGADAASSSDDSAAIPEVTVDEDGSLRISHENDQRPTPQSSDSALTDDSEEPVMAELPEPQPESEQEQEEDSQEPVVADAFAPSRVQAEHRKFLDGVDDTTSTTSEMPATDAAPSRFVAEPPITGSALNATTDQVTDNEPVLSVPSAEAPMLHRDTPVAPPPQKPLSFDEQSFTPPESSHPTEDSSQAASQDGIADETTLKELEAAVDSPHQIQPAQQMEGKTLQAIEEAVGVAPEPAPMQPESSTLPDQDDVRARIDEALKNSAVANGPAMQPIEALGAGGRMDIGHDEEPDTSKNIAIDTEGTLSFPQNLVSDSKELPKDETAASTQDATAPPPVPPPMTMPPPAPSEAGNKQL